MFQLVCALQYELTADLRAVAAGDRWCSRVEALAEFRVFAFGHPALAAVTGRRAMNVEFYLTGI